MTPNHPKATESPEFTAVKDTEKNITLANLKSVSGRENVCIIQKYP